MILVVWGGVGGDGAQEDGATLAESQKGEVGEVPLLLGPLWLCCALCGRRYRAETCAGKRARAWAGM